MCDQGILSQPAGRGISSTLQYQILSSLFISLMRTAHHSCIKCVSLPFVGQVHEGDLNVKKNFEAMEHF